jgi:large repetitive protein
MQCVTVTYYRKLLKLFAVLCVAGLVALVGVSTSQAVDNTINNGDVDALITAINNANDNPETPVEIVLAENGTYTLDVPFEDHSGLPIITSNVSIYGNGATIERGVTAPDNFRIIEIAGTGSLQLQDVSIKNGQLRWPRHGGGIQNHGIMLLSNVTISNNNADFGGALRNTTHAELTITDSVIAHNTATHRGGGIQNYGALSVSNTFFAGNVSRSNRNESELGGAILNEASGTLTVNAVTFDDNDAGTNGGGIYNQGSATVINSTFNRNTARDASHWASSSFGGALHNRGTLDLVNSTIFDSFAENNGGGIYNRGLVTVTNSTIAGNRAGYEGGRWQPIYGGGIYNHSEGVAILTNTIVGNNSARADGPDMYGEFTSEAGHNLVSDASASTGLTAGEQGNVIGDASNPVDPLLDNLAHNGGQTMTLALREGSPAIDAGNDEVALVPPVDGLDQRGFVRPVDGTGDGVARSDIGSYEFGAMLPATSPDEQLQQLAALLDGMDIQRGTANALSNTLNAADSSLEQGNEFAACGQLNAFAMQVEAQRGKHLTDHQAGQLMEGATEIRDSLDC